MQQQELREHVTPVLASFLWLPEAFKFHFKALHGLAPSYLTFYRIMFQLALSDPRMLVFLMSQE